MVQDSEITTYVGVRKKPGPIGRQGSLQKQPHLKSGGGALSYLIQSNPIHSQGPPYIASYLELLQRYVDFSGFKILAIAIAFSCDSEIVT